MYARFVKDFNQHKPIANLVEAQSRMREAAQAWKELSEAEKQVFT